MLVVIVHQGNHIVDHLVRTHEGSSAFGWIRNDLVCDLLAGCALAVEEHRKLVIEALPLFAKGGCNGFV